MNIGKILEELAEVAEGVVRLEKRLAALEDALTPK